MDTTSPNHVVRDADADGFVRGSRRFGFGFGSSWYEVLLISAGATIALLTIMVYGFQLNNHLNHWRKPDLQKCYLRIAMIAPTYAFFSWLSIARSADAANYDTFRAIMEGYVLWTFFSMMLYGAGGETAFHNLYNNNTDVSSAIISDTDQENASDAIFSTIDTAITSTSTSTLSSISTSISSSSINNSSNSTTINNSTSIDDDETTTLSTAEDPMLENDQQQPLPTIISCYFFPPALCGCGKMFQFKSTNTALLCWKLCLFQFVIVKPGLSTLTAWSERHDTAVATDRWIKPIALCSVTLAMWALLSTFLALAPVSASFRKLQVLEKFVVIKCAIFLTVAQELCFHILVASGVVSSPYCWWAGPSEKCLDIMGFSTPSARRGTRTIASLVILEMFLLQFLLLRYYSYADNALGDIKHISEMKVNVIEFLLQPSWIIEPSIVHSHKYKKVRTSETFDDDLTPRVTEDIECFGKTD